MEIGEATGQVEEARPDPNEVAATKTFTTSKLRNTCYAADSAATKFAKDLRSATRPVRRRKCWELFVGLGLVSYCLRLDCVEVKQFSLQSGRDLTEKKHQRAFPDSMDRAALRGLVVVRVRTSEPDPGPQLLDGRVAGGP